MRSFPEINARHSVVEYTSLQQFYHKNLFPITHRQQEEDRANIDMASSLKLSDSEGTQSPTNHNKHFDFELPDNLVRQIIMMSLWYLFSFGSIISNKYILSTLNGDATVLGEAQLLSSVIFGAFKMYLPCCLFHRTSGHEGHSKLHFLRNMAMLGWMRFGAIVCSLISLKYVAVSFTETVKSSSPIFTSIIARIMLGDKSGIFVNLTLIPIMVGLCLCTATELSFNTIGFVSAIINNLMDCFQNVFSKKLLSSDHAYSPPELQFYTSAAALVVQIPFWIFFKDINVKLSIDNYHLISMLILNGFMFYMQSLTAFGLMALISPLTFSVSNTFKRAILIWFSVLVFGNQVSPLSALGTLIVTCGVFLYQRAKHREKVRQKERMLSGKGQIEI